MRNGDRFHDPEDDYCTMSMMSIIAEDLKPCRWERRWRALRYELNTEQHAGGGLVISMGLPDVLCLMTEISRKIK